MPNAGCAQKRYILGLTGGKQRIESRIKEFANGTGNIAENLSFQTNAIFKDPLYEEKKTQITVLLVTPKGNKIAGVVNLDLASYLNRQLISKFCSHLECTEEYKLEKCPDKNGRLVVQWLFTKLEEIDFDG